MIYELRTYTVKPGTHRRHGQGGEHGVARHPQGRLRQARRLLVDRDRAAQSGPAHVELQRVSTSARRLRAELAKNPRWTGEYVPLIRPAAGASGRPPDERGEAAGCAGIDRQRLRTPQLSRQAAGGLKQWLDAFTAVLPEREKYSKIVGLWHDRSGPTERSLPHLGLSQPERPRRSAWQRA